MHMMSELFKLISECNKNHREKDIFWKGFVFFCLSKGIKCDTH